MLFPGLHNEINSATEYLHSKVRSSQIQKTCKVGEVEDIHDWARLTSLWSIGMTLLLSS
jgi:hypothetical protein